MIEVLDHGYVKIADLEDENTWGSDENIIRAARMSTDKGFLGWGGDPCPSCVNEKKLPAHLYDPHCPVCRGSGFTSGDERLLRYLWQNKHSTPFEMAGLTLEIQCPIFVAREWMRHRTQSYSELSARYTPLPDLFYIPSIERLMAGKQSTKNKQSSEGGFIEQDAEEIEQQIKDAGEYCREIYEDLLHRGVSRELARLVIPVNQYTRFRASANLRNWLGFLQLRLGSSAQFEIRQYAQAIASIIEQEFPRTWELFNHGQ